jgi:uncharacterized protein YfiM (DUF2279 family)
MLFCLFFYKTHRTMKKILPILLFFCAHNLAAQSLFQNFLHNADTLNKPRLYIAVGTATVFYTGVVYTLDKYWYADYPRSAFHTFDDSHEWLQMDKSGHFFTTYFESKWASGVFQWTGMRQRRAAIVGSAVGLGLQTTLEILDGTSAEWGFSWSDMAANTAGAGLFLGQELAWREQRISLKLSAHSRPASLYNTSIIATNSSATTTLGARADALYGSNTNPLEVALKDYNNLTIWTSVNIWSFLPDRENSKFPRWLNVAVGYGAENLYRGETAYDWTDKNGNHFALDAAKYPRYRQIYIAPDIDLTKIKTKSKVLKTLFSAVNIIKFPLPTLEINGQGGVLFHPIYF